MNTWLRRLLALLLLVPAVWFIQRGSDGYWWGWAAGAPLALATLAAWPHKGRLDHVAR